MVVTYMGSSQQVRTADQLVLGQRYACDRTDDDIDKTPFGGVPFTVVSPPSMALSHDGRLYPHVAVLVERGEPSLAHRPVVSPSYPVQAEAVLLSHLGIRVHDGQAVNTTHVTYRLSN